MWGLWIHIAFPFKSSKPHDAVPQSCKVKSKNKLEWEAYASKCFYKIFRLRIDLDALFLNICRKNIRVKMQTIREMSLCAFILERKVRLWTRSSLCDIRVRAFESKECLPLCCFLFMRLFHAVFDFLLELLSFLVC